MRSRAGQRDARSERLSTGRLPGAGVCAAQAQAAFRGAEGNAFTLVLREVSNRDDVEQRLIDICVKGVPNYFGAQRFGIGGSNLQGALRWAQTNTPVRDRNKRSFWLSAARSALFNQIVAERLKKADVNQVVDGDALQLAGRGSWFVATTEELAELQRRVNDKELMITAALPGSGEWGTQREALAFEQAAVAEETELQTLLVREKLKPRAERCCCIRNN